VADFRDPWIGLHLRTPPTAVHRRIHERMESGTVRADRVVVATRWQEDALRAAYPEARIVRIPNGYDDADFSHPPAATPPPDRFVILHSGMLTLGRSTRPFLEGLALFVKRNPGASASMRVVFLGARETGNERWVARFGLEQSVSFEDNIPHRECVERERASHVLLLLKHDDERYRGLIPGKLFEYFGAGRPVLAVVPGGEAADLVRDLRRGEIADIADSADIAAVIERMYTRFLEGRLESAYDLGPLEQYTRRYLANRMSDVLAEAAEER
jgi:glycosyltransferase involved in cell wall biosynthesis